MLGNLEIAALATSLREINQKRAPKDRCVLEPSQPPAASWRHLG